MTKAQIDELLTNAKEAFLSAIYGEQVRTGFANVDDAVKAAVDELWDRVDDGAFTVVGVLPSGSVLEVEGNTVYLLSGANTYTGLPNWIPYSTSADKAAAAGYLMSVVYSTNSQMLVYFSKNYGIMLAFKTSDSWGDWMYGTDNTLTRANASADAKVVGDILYNGTTRENKTPIVSSFWDYESVVTGNVTQFGVADMPRSTFTRCNSSKFSDKPIGVSSNYAITIIRQSANVAGNVSLVFCVDEITQKIYMSNYSETVGTVEWTDLSVDNNAIVSKNVTITAENKSQYFQDTNNECNADYAPINSVYRILAEAEVKNTPKGNGYSTGAGNYDGTVRSVTGYLGGTLLTYKGGGDYPVQIFISGGNYSENHSKITVMYFRARYGPTSGWSDWHMLSDRAAITGANVVIRKKLIAPYEDAQGNPTATDTGIANHQRIIGDPFYFDDFNNAPLNSIVQVDLDCDATVMANNPLSGKSNILQTWCWSYYRRHAVVQFCIGIDSGTAFYYRYGYENAPSDYRWTEWESARATTDKTLVKEDRAADSKTVGDMFGKTPVMKGVLESGDVQSIDGNGLYALSGSNTYTQLPSWAGDTNAKRAGYIQQVELNSASKILIYYHKTLGIGTCVCTGGTWGDWIRIPAAYVPFPTTAEAGNVLAVNDDGEYFNVAFQTLLGLFLPQPTQADAGKILKVDSNGKYVLAAP